MSLVITLNTISITRWKECSSILNIAQGSNTTLVHQIQQTWFLFIYFWIHSVLLFTFQQQKYKPLVHNVCVRETNKKNNKKKLLKMRHKKQLMYQYQIYICTVHITVSLLGVNPIHWESVWCNMIMFVFILFLSFQEQKKRRKWYEHNILPMASILGAWVHTLG